MIEDGDAVPEPAKVDDIAKDAAKHGAIAFMVSVDAPDATVRVNITARERQIEKIDALAEKAGLKWRGQHEWDPTANIGFSPGYTPQERRKLVDVYMADFKAIFGYYPSDDIDMFLYFVIRFDGQIEKG